MKNGGLLLVAAVVCAWGQTRGIVPEEVILARPQKAAGVAPQPKYQPLNAAGRLHAATGARQLGVTIWRLRLATEGDGGARILVQEEAGAGSAEAWIPERVSSGGTMRAGDRVRLTLESPEPGYLYVVDRERYADGSRGTPWLIFPTTRTRNGDNHVTAGKLADIPAQDDRPNFFTLRKTRPDQAEEELTAILTSRPLQDLSIGPKALALSVEEVAGWEKQWGRSHVEAFELTGGAGKAWTAAEQSAAAGGSRVLTQEDPAPQTVYSVAAGRDEPLLVKVRLRYAR
jgi:hypothetical protein